MNDIQCKVGDVNRFLKGDIAFNQITQEVQIILYIESPDSYGDYQSVLAIAQIDICDIQYYKLSLTGDVYLSKKFFAPNLVYMEYGLSLYAYDINASLGKYLIQNFFILSPSRLYQNYIFLLDFGQLNIYFIGETSIYRKINLSPQTITNFSYYPKLNYLILFLENEMRIYDFQSMDLLEKFQVLQFPSIFTNQNLNKLYVIEFDSVNSSNILKIFDLDKREISFQTILSQKIEIFTNFNMIVVLEEDSNIAYSLGEKTLMGLDLRLIQNQPYTIPNIFQFVYITGTSPSDLYFLHSKNLKYLTINSSCCITSNTNVKLIEEYYIIDQRGILSFIDSQQNRYKQIKNFQSTKIHIVAKKVDNNHYVIVANDFEIICLQKDIVLDSLTIRDQKQQYIELSLTSNQDNIFAITKDSIYDIQYSFADQKIVLKSIVSLSNSLSSEDVIFLANGTLLVYIATNTLYINYNNILDTYIIQGKQIFNLQKLGEDMFSILTSEKLLIYLLYKNNINQYKIQQYCNIPNNQIQQFNLVGRFKIIVIEDSLKRVAIYSYYQEQQNCLEQQSIALPCYSGNTLLITESTSDYFAISCSLQTNIYQRIQQILSQPLPPKQITPAKDYYLIVSSLKGTQVNQFVIIKEYIFCSLNDKMIVISMILFNVVYEINLSNFFILHLQFEKKDDNFNKFFIRGVQDYQRINFEFIAQSGAELQMTDQSGNIINQNQLPLCYMNIYSSFTKKDQIKLFDNLKLYQSIMNQQIEKIILQVILYNQFQLIDELESDAYELKIFSDPSTQRNINIQTLLQINKQSIQYSGLSIYIPENTSFTNPNRRKIAIQNSVFVKDINNSTFIFQNLDQIILVNITFQFQNVLTVDRKSDYFVSFSNISDVIIEDMSFIGIQEFSYRGFFSFKQIRNQLVINGMKLVHFQSSQLETFIKISASQQVILSNIYISNVTSLYKTYTQKYLILLEGVSDSILKHVQVEQLTDIAFFKYINNYVQGIQKVYLTKDKLLHYNITCFNTTSQNSLFWILATNFTLDGISNSYTQIKGLDAVGAVYKIQGENVLIRNSYFAHNNGKDGGAFNFQEIVNCVIIENCLLERNTANQFGGAIKSHLTCLIFENSTIRFNQAMIGGGIYYYSIKPQNTNMVISNIAEIYGNNIGSNLQYFNLKIQTDEDCQILNNIQNTVINNFRSGGSLNLFFEVYDEEKNPIKIVKQKFEQYPLGIKREIEKIKITAIANIADSIKLSNQQSSSYLDYNEATKQWQLPNLKVIGSTGKSQKISLFSENIYNRYIFDNDSNSSGYLNYTIFFNFRQCQRGEKQSYIDDLIQCLPCPNGFYSLVTPSENSSVECIICPPSAYQCEKDQIFLREGYWRSSNSTENIYYCDKMPSNCKGSIEGNRNYCNEGKIGPLCETCDLYGEVWGEKFMRLGKFDCVKCRDVQDRTFILPIAGIFTFILVYVVFSVNMSIKMSKGFSYTHYFRVCKILTSNRSQFQDISPFYFKILLNYIQISLVTNNYYLQIPPILAYLPDILSLPLQHFLNIFDCQFSNIDESLIPVIFLRVLWSYFLPFIFLLVIIMVYSIIYCIQKCIISYREARDLQNPSCYPISLNNNKRMMIYHLYNGLFFLLIFMQPSQVEILLSTISCKEIDGEMFISSDPTFQCYTKNHAFYVGTMIIPGLLLWIFIIPLTILFLLNKARDRLDSLSVRFSFGFLYQEYKSKYFYWEFVKSYFKIGVVLIGIFLNETRIAKLIIICFILAIYQYFARLAKPYILIKLNRLDQIQVNILIIIALFNAFIENPPSQAFKQLIIVVTIILHNSFLFVNLFLAIFLKLEAKFGQQTLRLKIFLKKALPFIFNFLEVKQPINLIRVNKNWKKVINFIEQANFKKNFAPLLAFGKDQFKQNSPTRQRSQSASNQLLNKLVTTNLGSENNSPTSLTKRIKSTELFKFNSAAVLSKKNLSPPQKTDKINNSLSDIKEEDSNIQFDVIKQAKSRSLNETELKNKRPSQTLHEATFNQLPQINQEEIASEKSQNSIQLKKKSGDNISSTGDEINNQRIKSSSKSLLQSQADLQSFHSINNSQNQTKKLKSPTQRGLISRFTQSQQSKQTTQPGSPQNQILSQYVKKYSQIGMNALSPQVHSQFINSRITSSTPYDENGALQQRANSPSESVPIIQASSQNFDLFNSRNGSPNSRIKNEQQEISLIYNNSGYATPSASNIENFKDSSKVQLKKMKLDSIRYKSSSSLSSEESSQQGKNKKQSQKCAFDEEDQSLTSSQKQCQGAISPSQLVDNTIPYKFQNKNIGSSIEVQSNNLVYSNQIDYTTINPTLISPNIRQTKLSLIDNSSFNSLKLLQKYTSQQQQKEFQNQAQEQSEQQSELINFEESSSKSNFDE